MEFAGEIFGQGVVGDGDPQVPLRNLLTLSRRMDSVQRFLSDSVNRNVLISKDQIDMVSSEIASAIQQIFVNGAALIACSQKPLAAPTASPIIGNSSTAPDPDPQTNFPAAGKIELMTELKAEAMVEDVKAEDFDPGSEIVELDAMELLAEHIHFCEICGKGFKRDANLRMHMRAHGNQFKTAEALAKPMDRSSEPRARGTRFSCPYEGCNRNKEHKKFRPLKSVICVKNHFKRSHCPKMYSCNRCNKKSFSVVADLKSHLKHCGESRWRCSCGTTFSRKDKLFGHMALFEGHMPAVVDEDEKGMVAATAVAVTEEDEDEEMLKDDELDAAVDRADDDAYLELLVSFGSVDDNYCFQDLIGFSNDTDAAIGVL